MASFKFLKMRIVFMELLTFCFELLELLHSGMETERIVVCMSRFAPCTQNVWVGGQEEKLNQCVDCGV